MTEKLERKQIMETKKEGQVLRYRIYYGYSAGDYIAITENELERAKYAWQTGAIFSHGIKSVKGAEFKRIEPDFRHYTGWYDEYSPKDSGDFLQLKRDMPDESLFQARLNKADDRVRYILNTDQPQLLSTPEKVDTLLLN